MKITKRAIILFAWIEVILMFMSSMSYKDCVKQRVIENRSMFHLTAQNLCRLVACAIRRLAVRQLTQNQNAMIGQRTSGHSPKAQGEGEAPADTKCCPVCVTVPVFHIRLLTQEAYSGTFFVDKSFCLVQPELTQIPIHTSTHSCMLETAWLQFSTGPLDKHPIQTIQQNFKKSQIGITRHQSGPSSRSVSQPILHPAPESGLYFHHRSTALSSRQPCWNKTNGGPMQAHKSSGPLRATFNINLKLDWK